MWLTVRVSLRGYCDRGLLSRCEASVGPSIVSDGSGIFGYALFSPSGNLKLQMQDDGNVVVYRVSPFEIGWAGGLEGIDSNIQPFRFVLQPDGNVVRYDANYGLGAWPATSTNPHMYNGYIVGKRLVMEDGGSVVVIDETSGQVVWRDGVVQCSSRDNYGPGWPARPC